MIGRIDAWHRAATPSVAVALVALILQAAAVGMAPRLIRRVAVDRITAQDSLDYAAAPALSLPSLEQVFVDSRLRAITVGAPQPTPRATDTRSSLGPSSSPGAVPRPTSGPTPAPSAAPPLLPPTQQLAVSYRTDKASAGAGEDFRYQVVVRNRGSENVLASFSINTHTPMNTFRCSVVIPEQESCTIAGDYDGESTDPADSHVNPPQQDVTRMVNAGSERVIFELHCTVADTAQAGTTIRNHAHVDVIGDGQTAATHHAPDVIVSSGFRVSR